MLVLINKYRRWRQRKQAYALLNAHQDRIEITPENVLILWDGLRGLPFSEDELVSRLSSSKGTFYQPATVCLELLRKATELCKTNELPERVFYPPEEKHYRLTQWLSDQKGRHLDYIDFLLLFDGVLREHVEYMELSKGYEAEHEYEHRVEQLYYVYCDVITFLEVILRRQQQ